SIRKTTSGIQGRSSAMIRSLYLSTGTRPRSIQRTCRRRRPNRVKSGHSRSRARNSCFSFEWPPRAFPRRPFLFERVLSRSAAVPRPVVQSVFVQFAAQSVAVNAQHAGSAGLIAVGAVQHAFDEFFLELAHRYFEKDATLNHHA